ncbi:hypothetical protein GLOIN_2v1486967 [Rhizophagus clarus]|uniref:Uncharacterized protein n=1 Tax=Rhizophagus clarus TaxID=94130 RepID=A0A8H3LMH6_9GLOM|nr:hypothetical protein GLOIN_2v1486967 [Rhizophagus clarus]
MDLDSRAYSKLFIEYNTYRGSEEYKRIFDAIGSLSERYDHETPEMWCSCIRNPFRKILEDNPRIFSKNGYITMNVKHYSHDKAIRFPSNYIYCSVCDSLVFTPYKYAILVDDSFRDSHLKRCISGNTISNKHAIRNEILKSIDIWKYQIWRNKQFILEVEAKLYRLRLELFSQSTLHSEKDKMASVSYDSESKSTSYDTYKQVKMGENTMPSTPKFEPACISPTRQCDVSVPEFRNLWNDRLKISNISSSTTLDDLVKAYFDNIRKNA